MKSEKAATPWLAIGGLWAVVIAQPVLDLIARTPEFLVAHRAGRLEILTFTAILVLAAPALLAGLAWAVGRLSARAGRALSLLIIGLLVAMLAAQVAKHAGVRGWPAALAIATAAGVAGAASFARYAPVRAFADILAIGVVAVPVIFLINGNVGRLLERPAHASLRPGVTRSGASARAPRAPVVLVVLDEMPLISLLDAERRIDAALYPNIAALARDGVWYRNATTVSDYTRWAVPSILSGRYPVAPLVPTAHDHPNTLFTLLAGTHRMEVSQPLTNLCPEDICVPPGRPLVVRLAAMAADVRILLLHVLLTDDLKPRLPGLSGNWAGFGGQETRAERRRRRLQRRRGETDKEGLALLYIENITAQDRQPSFYFLHTLLPHFPHVSLPTGQRNGTRASIPAIVSDTVAWTDDEWGVLQYYQRHLMQISVVDRVIGQLVSRLRALGLYEGALIILTADHGTSFMPDASRRNFSATTAAEIVRVPLIVKYPAGIPRGATIDDRNVETIDIAPTIADVLGFSLPWVADGGSLLDESRPERPEKRVFHTSATVLQTYAPDGPDVAPLLKRKLDVFDGAANPWRVPRPPRFGELVGRPLEQLRISGDAGGVRLAEAERFQQMDVRADPVPFDVAGQLERAPRGQPAFVAVAVNGVVRAVTRTWKTEPQQFLATPPLEAWRNGRNDLQVFLVEADARGALLRPLRLR